mmetsp:Transcript_154973/g.495587  ORF Transcript_154973/g.495587 Transcript_154973/m.495587 type:complete len:207 (+) Transcript_154973:2683-3303(+)
MVRAVLWPGVSRSTSSESTPRIFVSHCMSCGPTFTRAEPSGPSRLARSLPSSVMPAAACSELPGAAMPVVALDELPPKFSSFSRIVTLHPRSNNSQAAERPARPPPTTMTRAFVGAIAAGLAPRGALAIEVGWGGGFGASRVRALLGQNGLEPIAHGWWFWCRRKRPPVLRGQPRGCPRLVDERQDLSTFVRGCHGQSGGLPRLRG